MFELTENQISFSAFVISVSNRMIMILATLGTMIFLGSVDSASTVPATISTSLGTDNPASQQVTTGLSETALPVTPGGHTTSSYETVTYTAAPTETSVTSSSESTTTSLDETASTSLGTTASSVSHAAGEGTSQTSTDNPKREHEPGSLFLTLS